ncbi:MAG: hypothetical protein A2Z25_22725 [Planctomycetes bacterium RBG_16_55_9]|nr:MAG: hypothetical protein A2Z25_22725 [Planctomycetes bacterium RBG_16_55_9]
MGERKCKYCKHFKVGTVMPAKHVWGDCMKPDKFSYDVTGKKRRGAFTWDDDSCDDFELRRTLLKPARDDSA